MSAAAIFERPPDVDVFGEGLLAVLVIVELRSAQPMFDMKLFKLPTFSGRSVAAFGLSASIFSMLLYLVLYLQDILGYSALATGMRLMVISAGILVTFTAAGVVPPHRAWPASGINSTFRQVGIATGIALLATLFSNNVKDDVLARVAAVPGLSGSGPQIATAVQSGEIGHVIARLPEHARLTVGTSTRDAFTTA